MKLTLLQRFKNAAKEFQRDTLQPVGNALSALTRAIGDWATGAWQQATDPPDESDVRSSLNVAVVYDCVRRIATDIAKMSPGIRRLDANGVWIRDTHQTLGRLLTRPNHFQTWMQFLICWVSSRLIAGNAYVIKLYNAQGQVAELIVLDPTKVTPMVASDTGKVFYQVSIEYLARIKEDALVAAEDLIHDRYLPLGHPLIGTAPLERAITAARARSGIMTNAADLNEHASVPPGILTTPEGLTEEQMNALADKWRAIPKGRIAVVDAAFKFEALAAKYVDSQSQELADLSAVDICIAFGMPPWKLGLGTRPVGEPEALQIVYLQDCLQWQVEDIEQCLDYGLDVPAGVYIELDPACLLKMDSKTKAEVAANLLKGIAKPNEMRAWFDLPPAEGGDAVYLQQQNYSLSALNARDLAAPAPSDTAPSPGGGSGGQTPETDKPQKDDGETPPSSRGLLPWAGVWRADGEYPAGCFVTHNGSLWACRQDACGLDGQPGTEPGTDYWRLAVKRGEVPTENHA